MRNVLFNLLPYRASATGLSRYVELLLEHWPGEKPIQLRVAADGHANLFRNENLPNSQNSQVMQWLQSNALVQHAVPVKRLISNLSPELVYSPFTDFLFGLGSLPQVITCHDLIPLFFPNSRKAFLRSKFWLPFHLNRAQKIIAISKSVADQLVKFGLSADQIEVVFNGIEKISNPIRSPRSGNFLIIARHARNKNLNAALDGYARFLEKEPNWDGDLVVVGSLDKTSAFLKRRAIDLNISNRVSWLSELKFLDLDNLLRSSFCLISSSLMEGFDYPLLEAQARGIPTLASDIPVHRELHSQHSLLFALEDEGMSLASHLKDLVKDPALWSQLSTNGYEHAGQFSLQRQVKGISNVFQQVLP